MTATFPEPILSAPCRLDRHDTCPEPRRCECGCHEAKSPVVRRGGRLARVLGRWT